MFPGYKSDFLRTDPTLTLQRMTGDVQPKLEWIEVVFPG